MANSFGRLFRITTFGESHGLALGVVVDGCPAGVFLSHAGLQEFMNRRRPGVGPWASSRKELDEVIIVSGVEDQQSTGAPLCFLVYNRDQRPCDYVDMQTLFRPSHGDFTSLMKYGHHAKSGGGRTSARETLARVAAGFVAKALLQQHGLNIEVTAFVQAVGSLSYSYNPDKPILAANLSEPLRCPDLELGQQMLNLIAQVRADGDSIGGSIVCQVDGVPAGLGEPVFDKLDADLAKAMLSIPACKAFEIGSGFLGCQSRGSQQNDAFFTDSAGRVATKTNNSGGIQAGISNGCLIYFRVGFKPPSTIALPQMTIDRDGMAVELRAKGRHDPCVLPRALVVVEAMTWLVLADHYLAQNAIFASKTIRGNK